MSIPLPLQHGDLHVGILAAFLGENLLADIVVLVGPHRITVVPIHLAVKSDGGRPGGFWIAGHLQLFRSNG